MMTSSPPKPGRASNVPTAPPALPPSAGGRLRRGCSRRGIGRAPPAGWPVPAVSPASEMAAPAGQDLAGDPLRWLILGVVLAGTFIAIVDVPIVNPGGDARQERPVPGGHVIAGPGQGTRRPLRDKREPKRGVRFSIAIAQRLCNVVISLRGW